jgi:indolepyruvate ferredoxin oxidoreductase beta subunit
MKKDIILAGVGGQGILSIAAVIDLAALESGLNIKQAEVHGMSQRGGAVQSHLRMSDKEIYSDLIPSGNADLIISVEPLEVLRYLNYLSPEGYIITSADPFVNIPNYPEHDKIRSELGKRKNILLIEAEKIARDCGSSKTSNMVILGASSEMTGLKNEMLEKAIRTLFKSKGEEIIEMNIRAFNKGHELFRHRK